MRLSTRILITIVTSLLVAGLARLDAGGLLKKSDIPRAIQQLKTGTPKQKAAAAEALGKRGAVRATDVKAAIKPLKILVAKDSDEKVRAAAAEALGSIAPEPKQTVMLLLKTLKEDKSDDVKVAAMIAIGKMSYAAQPAMAELRKLAKNKDNKKLSRTARNVLRSIRKKKG